MLVVDYAQELYSEKTLSLFSELYGKDTESVGKQLKRYKRAIKEFSELYPLREEVSIYSAPGRTEIGGNHTDHQRGAVLAGAVNLDAVAVVAFHNDGVVRVKSDGYEYIEISLADLSPTHSQNGTAALIKGVISRFKQTGVDVLGFDMYVTSEVISGSGISSSAAFEILVGTIINLEYNKGKSTPLEIAKCGWYAENFFFGKKCGLLDQTVSSYGGLVSIDFKNKNEPVIEPLSYDFEFYGYSLCITDTKSSHADLTDDYTAIREEMMKVAAFFDREVLSEVDKNDFFALLPDVRKTCGDRAVLRAIHFFEETERAHAEAEALKRKDIDEFLNLVNRSGDSSAMLLQNLYSVKSFNVQPIPLALAVSKRILGRNGAVRVHGGGFAGTIQAFVPADMTEKYKNEMERIFGEGSCYHLNIRPVGGIKVI